MATTGVHPPVREDWLARSEEPLAVPDIPIVDAHHHLWDRPGSRYLLGEYLRDLEQVPQVRATVYVQCRSSYLDEGPDEFKPLGEIRFARSIAEASPPAPAVCQAVVGGADLLLGNEIERVLDAMEEDSGGRLRGIRNQTAWHPDSRVVSSPFPPEPDRMLRKEFRAGVRALGRRGLSLDVWAYHTQLGQVLALARECPETPIIVDHFGGPLGVGPYTAGSRAVLDRWSRDLDGLSRCPNVVMKLSGAGMRVFGFGFDQSQSPPISKELASAMTPYFDACLARFGASRCMLASNFPVDKGMFGYRILWNAFAECAASLPAAEQHELFHRTAARTYRLGELRTSHAGGERDGPALGSPNGADREGCPLTRRLPEEACGPPGFAGEPKPEGLGDPFPVEALAPRPNGGRSL